MKKLFAVLLALMLLFPVAGVACESTQPPVLTVNSPASQTAFSDPSWWPLTEDHILAGIKVPDEPVPHMGTQTVYGMYVAGLLDNGWMRQAGAIRTLRAGDQVLGLTLLRNVTITVQAEYLCLAESIVHDLLGNDTPISANAIAACATWWSGDYASTIFFPSYSDRAVIGSVTFNHEDVTPLYVGHFGEQLRFGLACGWWIPEPEPVPAQPEQPIASQASASASATAQASVNVQNSGSVDNSGDGCYRNNVIIQVNVMSWVKNCLKVIKEACQ